MIEAGYVYPSYGVQNPDALLALLGRFWADVYDGKALLRKLLQARGELAEQTYRRLTDSRECVSRLTVPVLGLRRWHAHVIRRSAGTGGPYRFGDAELRYGEAQIAYGQARPGLSWPAPAGLVRLGAVADGLAAPTVLWVDGVDVFLDPVRGTLTFPVDPFASPFPGVDLPDGDREITLWLFCPQFDEETVYRQWGYAVGLAGPSVPAYRDGVNALFDALTGGSALAQVRTALEVASGVELAASDGETVEAVEAFAGRVVVVTDRRVYTYGAAARPRVAVGDVVAAGAALTDGLEIVEVNRGGVPPGWRAVVAGPELLAVDLGGEIVFEDTVVPWAGEIDADGDLKLFAPLGGDQLAVLSFWDEVHERGKADGVLLADLLDRRTDKAGPVRLENLDPVVNPLRFLIDNVLRFHTVFARVRAGAGTPGRAFRSDLVRRVGPAEATVLVLVELPSVAGSVTLPPAVPGGFTPAAAVAATLTPGSAVPFARPVDGYCQ